MTADTAVQRVREAMEAGPTPGDRWTTETGVRNSGGYIFHTNSVPRWQGQDERYAREVAEREADKQLAVACTPEAMALILAELDRLAATGWRDISSAPKGVKVLAGYWNKLGNWRTVTARYYLPQTLMMDDNRDDLDDDGYAPAGWYEESETQEGILTIEEPPTVWMPLPPPPTLKEQT